MFVKPKKGRSVHDPARGDLLPEEGRNVDESQYWYRRELDGDIEIVQLSKDAETDKKVSAK
ncbi:TPA: DUF2635 domain-containing protein [Enterobacter roggenkampii]|uniref:DUF2635 domain-containing protein n=1 Tax=Enterobacter cloacae complex TaxID=354276 RepID=UPI0005F98A63|nr:MULTISPECIES: DUF2635 domain-containing protein [Enterobacter cloacae complex]KJW82007.1 hypothetical protein SG67_15790 [Enterobacter asburiae]KJX09239.1 hypothetical protein SG66_17930 [Enterobacter asburiae]MCK7200109.1 DUF2635 domain-containing protein [Enterobacter roggenkampii]OUR39214.1 DUF2635 domain-containing protein [Enterobacter roggenkampii]HDW0515938.1 DUF2635 domain-containing protein [Enterobacter asburiae]